MNYTYRQSVQDIYILIYTTVVVSNSTLLTVIMTLTKKLEEAEEVTREFIVRHHFLIWAEEHRKRRLFFATESFSSASADSSVRMHSGKYGSAHGIRFKLNSVSHCCLTFVCMCEHCPLVLKDICLITLQSIS